MQKACADFPNLQHALSVPETEDVTLWKINWRCFFFIHTWLFKTPVFDADTHHCYRRHHFSPEAVVSIERQKQFKYI